MENINNPMVNQPTPAPQERKVIKISLRVIVIVIIIVLLGFLLYRFKSIFVAAMVDGRPISRLTVIKELEKHGGKDALEMLINKKLLTNEAKKKGISVSSEEVDKEIKKYETDFAIQGNTLDDTLEAQGLTREDLKEQVAIQKTVEKLLEEKTKVSDEELNKYITDNQVTLPAGKEEETKTQIKEQIKQQKLQEESSKLLENLRAAAKIRTFVKY